MNFSHIPDLIKKLKENDAFSKKNLGQHFLIDDKVLDKIVQISDININDNILEVGPGMGVLTSRLLEGVGESGRVIGFEYDDQMVKILSKDYPELELVTGDAIITIPEVIKEMEQYKVVANIPYQISTPLLHIFLEAECKPDVMVLLVQKELGERVVSKISHKTRGYLSVLVEMFYESEVSLKVKPSSFWPAPKVDSVVIKLTKKSTVPYDLTEQKELLKFVYKGFTQKRKQIKKLLSLRTGKEVSEIVKVLEGCEMKDTVRAEEISLENWYKLFKILN